MKLGLILGDQLSATLPTLRALDRAADCVILAEVGTEARYVPHHPQKIALLFSAMRHFAEDLRQQGWQVIYHAYDPDVPQQTLFDAVRQHCDQQPFGELHLTECGEYRLMTELRTWPTRLGIPVRIYADDRFVCSIPEFRQWASGRQQLRMEYFYREMRRKTGLLMDKGQPVGGQWNFDSDNRQPWRGEPALPPQLTFVRDDIDRTVIALVLRHFAHHPGSLVQFRWGTTREQALSALSHFIEYRLPWFGTYQDAMVNGEDTLFHSLLAPYLNCGLLSPLEVCRAAEQAWRNGHAPLNGVEGFIRQIIGWREYVRGIYWLKMPGYAQENALGNTRPLPRFYWDGDTRMHCMAECFRTTFDNAYAHHIQRLMVTGNFALLAGITPEAICEWYLAVYADAYDWVELPNTLGMVMHADGGVLGSKPYAASGNYIHKMSDYCGHCHYNVKTATESDSCPFNSLYWHFMARHRERFASNPRMAMTYRSFDRMNAGKREQILRRGEQLLQDLDAL